MGFLNRLHASKALSHADWMHLDDSNQVVRLKEASFDKPAVIFKHSTTCGISARAKHVLESEWEELKFEVDFYYLDLLANRSVSNQVAELFGVVHQSPQVLVIYKGKAIFNNSHHKVGIASVNQALSQVLDTTN